MVVLWWCCGGVVVVLWWCCGGVVVVLLWCCCGVVVVVLWWLLCGCCGVVVVLLCFVFFIKAILSGTFFCCIRPSGDEGPVVGVAQGVHCRLG